MPPPKSQKLRDEEQRELEEAQQTEVMLPVALAEPPTGPVLIRKVNCCNDFIAVLQEEIHTNIALASGIPLKNEGVVVGVGPGIAGFTGVRLKPLFDIGEYVVFGPKNIIHTIQSASPPYKDRVVVFVSERNVICKLPIPVNWEEYQD